MNLYYMLSYIIMVLCSVYFINIGLKILCFGCFFWFSLKKNKFLNDYNYNLLNGFYISKICIFFC